MEERKFVCKYCNKRYPCGKSLGGHIRTHMNENSAQEIEGRNNADTIKFDAARKKKRDLASETAAGNSSIYGLRENPKKSMRFVHDTHKASVEERFCKECGKGFPSLKALCGHMACHSDKEKGKAFHLPESNSGFSTENKQKLVMDSQSDTEISAAPIHPRRSKRMKFKTLNNNSNQPSSVTMGNNSSSVSEVEQEQEEVARCLMLLSKDSSYKCRFALFTESSDNNSVVLEAKSPSADTKFAVKNGKKSVYNAYGLAEKKAPKESKLKSTEIGASDSDNSDSGYFRYGPKKADSDVSIEGYLKKDEFKRPRAEDSPTFEYYYDAESKKLLKGCRSRYTESKKLVPQDVNHVKTDAATRKFDPLSYNSIGASCQKAENNFLRNETYEDSKKAGKYGCLSSEKLNESYESAYNSGENSTDSDSYPAAKQHSSKVLNQKKRSIKSYKKKKLKTKKSKGHECPICYKIFKSGQALGGHKRSHFVGGSEENATLVIKQGSPAAVPCFIDLNLPAPVE